MAERNRPHVTVNTPAAAERYSPSVPGRDGASPPSPSDRLAHSRRLRDGLTAVSKQAEERRAASDVEVESAVDGIYVQFESMPDVALALASLEPRQAKIHPELRTVTEHRVGDATIQTATVFVPNGQIGSFVRKFEQYATEETKKGHPRHRNLVERIATLRLATLSGLWTDAPEAFPASGERVWWELWLRRRDGVEQRLDSFAEQADVRLGRRRLAFEDRLVVLVLATADQLGLALDVIDDVAELRKPAAVIQHVADIAAADQRDFVDDLAGRIVPPSDAAPATCVLDTGIAWTHPLIAPALDRRDAHTCEPAWGVADTRGHGTQIAGVALYGDLGQALMSREAVKLGTRLESVKVLPNTGTNEEHLYAALTAQAVAMPEITNPERRRSYVLAVTAEAAISDTDSGLGQPTAWSSAIDALAAGRAIDSEPDGVVYLDEPASDGQRLFVVSAGNVRHPLEANHLDRSDVEPVEEPAQSWNALTVGAYTELDDLSSDDTFGSWRPLAPHGELSPFSRTSMGFAPQWPYKPEVVFEGGNAAMSPSGLDIDTPSALQILTTQPPLRSGRLLTTAAGTSPAAATAANLVAEINSRYPHLWPETIRALIVHSARWTPRMEASFPGGTRPRHVQRIRRYGWGVPSRDRALRSADDSVTLVIQDRIHPYNNEKMREMHMHDLPWPAAVLSDLGDTPVEMRVALSYFIEPNPARRGWVRRFCYASHGLRFEVRRPTESRDDFRKRLNKLARDEKVKWVPTADDTGHWFLGPQQRVRGSLHVDCWRGEAADLASRGCMAVFPVTGWWKEQPKRDRSDFGVRYSLVVSIESPEVEVDIWTPIAVAIGVETTTEISASAKP